MPIQTMAALGAPAIIATGQGPVQVLSTGDGSVVLSLHGGMGGYDQSWLLAQSLGISNARILAVSRPGYFGTPLGSGPRPQDQADLCAALLDALGVGQAVVIAVSAGGPTALQFALQHSDRCRALMLVSACSGQLASPPEVRARLPLIKLLARIPFLSGFMRWRIKRDPERAALRAIPNPSLRARTLGHPEAGPLIMALQASAFDRTLLRLPGTLNDMANFESLEDYPLERIQAPMLVVHGTGDRIVPFSHAKRIAERAPHCELFAIEGGEHVVLFTHLDAVRTRVRSFLSGVHASGGSDVGLVLRDRSIEIDSRGVRSPHP
jgi:pimeloyl-ACP methyl ester carboxylesterase